MMRKQTELLEEIFPWDFLKIIYLFVYFLVVLDLGCCVRAFFSCREQGLLFSVMYGLRIAGASLVEHRLQACGLR